MAHHKITVDGVEYVPSGEALKQALHKADAELIAGLNGIGRAPATDLEAAELRRALIRARAECEAAGIEAETLLEFSERTRRADEAQLRQYAESVSATTRGMDRHRRRRLAWIAAGFAGVVTAAPFATTGGLLAGLVAALVVAAVASNWLADRYPTPGVLIGKRAFELELGVIDVWPQVSNDGKDYLDTFLRLDARARAKGRRHRWLKAR